MQFETLERRRLLSHGPDGVGVLGDSYSDEYQFYTPDRSSAMNYVEQLADDRHLKFGKFSDTSRGAPRNEGFAYNWAQSADTSTDMIADGQLAGLAGQVGSGKVDLAFVFIGGNDFRGVFSSADPVAALGTVVPQAVTNVFTAVNTVLASSADVNVVVATLPKVSVLPEVQGAIALGFLPQSLADAVDLAIGAFNEQVRGLAAGSSRVALADVDALVTNIFAPATFKFGGVTIDRQVPGNDPHSLWLADGIHAGTIGQGMLANLFVSAANEEFDVHVRRLGEREILKNAGLWRGNHCHLQSKAHSSAFGSARSSRFSEVEISTSRHRGEILEV